MSMSNDIEKMLNTMQKEDVGFVREAFSNALMQLKTKREIEEKEQKASLQNMSLDELNEELAKTDVFKANADERSKFAKLKEARNQKLQEERDRQMQPSPEQQTKINTKRAELQQQIEGIDEQIIELMPKVSRGDNFHQLRKLNYQKGELKRDLQSIDQ